jgi:hypothetical protein
VLDNRPIIVSNVCQAGRAGYKLTGIGGFALAFLKSGTGAFTGTLWSLFDGPAPILRIILFKNTRKRTIAEASTASCGKHEGGCGMPLPLGYGYRHAKATVELMISKDE